MNKKKGIIIVSCICIIIIALIGILAIEYLPAWLDEQEAKKAEEKERQIQEEYYIDEIVWMGVAEDGVSTCVIETIGDLNLRILPGKSVFLLSRYGEEVDFDAEYEEYLFKEYSIEDGTWRGIVDITEVLEEYPEYLISEVGTNFYYIDGENYIRVCIAIKPDEGESIYDYMDRQNIWKYIYLNIDTGKMFEGERNQFSDKIMGDVYSLLDNEEFLAENISEEFAERYKSWEHLTWFGPKTNGYFKIRLETADLPQQNEELYSLFPELKNYIGQEGYYVHLLIGNNPSAEYLLRLLMEDGKEISFEHMEPIPADESIDGQEHEVHSFEEYYQWKDIYWRDR